MPLLLTLLCNYELHCGDNQAHNLTKLPLGHFLSISLNPENDCAYMAV